MDIQNALRELADMIKEEIRHRMESPIGYNPRAKKNTLVGSDLYESVDVQPTDDQTLVLSILDYWEFVSLGWKRTGNFKGTIFQFHENIVTWIRRKGLEDTIKKHTDDTIDDTAWNVVWKIFDYGIVARPFLVYDREKSPERQEPNIMLPTLDKIIEDWKANIFEAICGEIDVHFN